MLTTPKISIVMPVLNRADTIRKALQSVVDQAYDNVELIIIDGGSTDSTVDIIKSYEKYISYWHSKPDGNPVYAYNFGIEKATGDLIAILMADDWYEPHTFAAIAAAFRSYPGVDMVTCGGRIAVYQPEKNEYKTTLLFASAYATRLTLYNICFDVSAICCRFITRKFYQRLGLYHPFNAAGEYVLTNDKEFLMRAVLAHAKNISLNHLGYTYLAHAGSSTFANNKANRLRMCAEHMETAEVYLRDKPLTLSQRCLLAYWFQDQATRLMIFYLLDKNFKQAGRVYLHALKKYSVLFPIASMLSCAVIVKRMLRKGLVNSIRF